MKFVIHVDIDVDEGTTHVATLHSQT